MDEQQFDDEKESKKVADRNRKIKERQDNDKDDIKFVLASVQGRRFMHRLIGMTGLYKSNFTGNSQTFFLEGERNIGLKLLAEIHKADFDGYLKMLNEFKGENDGNISPK